jgi:hypothetical protein
MSRGQARVNEVQRFFHRVLRRAGHVLSPTVVMKM